MSYNHKKVSAYLFFLFVVVVFIICYTTTFNSMGVFIFDFSLASLIVFAMLIFTKREVFFTWIKFAAIFLPVAIILVVMIPPVSGGLNFIDKKVATLVLSGVFLAVSVAIIFIKSSRLRGERQ